MHRTITFFWRKVLVYFFVVSLSFGMVVLSPITNATIRTDSSDIQKKMGQLDKSLLTLEDKIKRSQHDLSKEEKALAKIDTSIHDTLIHIKTIEKEMRESEKEVERLNSDIFTFKNQQQKKIRALELYLLSQQKHQDNHKLKFILNQKSIHDMVVLNKHYNSFSYALTQQIQQLIHNLKNLDHQQQSLERKRTELQELAKELSAKKEDFNKKKTLQKQSISQYQSSIQKNLDEKKNLFNEKQALNKLLKEIQIALEKQKKDEMERKKQRQQEEQKHKITTKIASHRIPEHVKDSANIGFGKMLGKLPSPLKNSKLKNKKNNSYYLAQEGSIVQAIYPGKVVFSEWLKGIGLLLI
ncbi:MAG TPA: hypothetical protein VFP93_00235, partial [Gammaproteobacteria bacterium]|nr:hypothetical protein [Gammaproteobacteria bacterium]